MELTVPETGEVDRVVELWLSLASGQQEYGSHLLAERNSERIRESILRHVVRDSVLVARDGKLVGFVMFSTNASEYVQDCTQGTIENLYVRPGRRDEGVGSRLLAAAEKRLQDAGVDAITLEVMAANDDARRFYRRHGYSPHRVEMEKQ